MPYPLTWWQVFLYRAKHLKVLRRINVIRRWRAYRRRLKSRGPMQRGGSLLRTPCTRPSVKKDTCAPLLSRQHLQNCAKLPSSKDRERAALSDSCTHVVSPSSIYVPDPPMSKSSSFKKPTSPSPTPPSLLLSSSSTFTSLLDTESSMPRSIKVPPRIRTKLKDASRPQTAGSDTKSSEREGAQSKPASDSSEGTASLQVLTLHAERQKLAKLKVPDSLMSSRPSVSQPKDNDMALLERLVTMKRKQMMQRLKEMDGDDAVDDSSSESNSPLLSKRTETSALLPTRVPCPPLSAPLISPPLTQPLVNAPLTPPPAPSSNSIALQRLLGTANDVEQQLDQLEKQARALTLSANGTLDVPQTASTVKSTSRRRNAHDSHVTLPSRLNGVTSYAGVKRTAEDSCSLSLSQHSSLSGTLSGALSGELSRPQTAQTDAQSNPRSSLVGGGYIDHITIDNSTATYQPGARNVQGLDSEFLLSPSTADDKESGLDSAVFLSPSNTVPFGSRSMSSGTFMSITGDPPGSQSVGSGGFLSPLTGAQSASSVAHVFQAGAILSPRSGLPLDPLPADSNTFLPRFSVNELGPRSEQSEPLTSGLDPQSTHRSSAPSTGAHSHLAADFPRGVELVEDMEAAGAVLRKMAQSTSLEESVSDAGTVQSAPPYMDSWRVPVGMVSAPRSTADSIPCCAASALLCDLDSASKAVSRLHALRQQQVQLSRMLKRGEDLRRSLHSMESVVAEVARLEKLNQQLAEQVSRLPAAEREYQELSAQASHLSELESELPGLRAKAASVELLKSERLRLSQGVARTAAGPGASASQSSNETLSWEMVKAMVDRLEELEGQNQVLGARNHALEGRNTFLEIQQRVLQQENKELKLKLQDTAPAVRFSVPPLPLTSHAAFTGKPFSPGSWPRSPTPSNSMAEQPNLVSPSNSLASTIQPLCSTPDLYTGPRPLTHQSG